MTHDRQRPQPVLRHLEQVGLNDLGLLVHDDQSGSPQRDHLRLGCEDLDRALCGAFHARTYGQLLRVEHLADALLSRLGERLVR